MGLLGAPGCSMGAGSLWPSPEPCGHTACSGIREVWTRLPKGVGTSLRWRRKDKEST